MKKGNIRWQGYTDMGTGNIRISRRAVCYVENAKQKAYLRFWKKSSTFAALIA